MSQIIYCRTPLPEGGGRAGSLAATRHAITEVLAIMERTPTDPSTGEFRIYYPVDSQLLRTWVTAEWRPNK